MYSGRYLKAGLPETKTNQKPRTFVFLQVGYFPGFNRVLEKGDSFHVCLCLGKLSLVDGKRTPPHSHTPSLMEGAGLMHCTIRPDSDLEDLVPLFSAGIFLNYHKENKLIQIGFCF